MKSYAYRSIPTLDIRAIVVLYRMRIEQFASIVCVVAFSLHPYWQIVIVVSLSDELGIATWAASATYHNKDSDFPSPTVRRGQVGDIGVMRGLARQNRHSRGTADGRSCEVAFVEGSLVNQMPLDVRHVVERVQVKVLIIGENEDHIAASCDRFVGS